MYVACSKMATGMVPQKGDGMKERKFIRGTKGERMSGTKTAFRNYRKSFLNTLGFQYSYRSMYRAWGVDKTSDFNP